MNIQGVLIGVIGLALALFSSVYLPNKTVSLGWVIPLGILVLIIIATLFNAAYTSYNLSEPTIPKVLYGRRNPTGKQDSEILCLLEPSPLFAYDALVSIYYADQENFEQLVGIGKVANIQQDGKIQVLIFYIVEGQKETANHLATSNSTVLRKTIVKPNVPNTYLSAIMERAF